jgi:TolA-binding protein
MSTVTEGDLKRLEDLINNRFNGLETRLDRIEVKVQELSVDFARVESKVGGLEKRLDDNNARLNTITFGIFSVVGVFATGILGIMAKIVFFPNP